MLAGKTDYTVKAARHSAIDARSPPFPSPSALVRTGRPACAAMRREARRPAVQIRRAARLARRPRPAVPAPRRAAPSSAARAGALIRAARRRRLAPRAAC
ncbi:hypothetical protein FFM54_28550 [Burkholderia pseudomallei]|nr:hypothetical protein FE789_11475 [Burkholderia pseudomallei]QCU53262.1 hypothetical protein FFM54_28550 [Burkholderia pseudomallei]